MLPQVPRMRTDPENPNKKVKQESSEEMNFLRSSSQSSLVNVVSFRDTCNDIKDRVLQDTVKSMSKWRDERKKTNGESTLLQDYTSLRVSFFDKWNRGQEDNGTANCSSSISSVFDNVKNFKLLARFRNGEDVSDSDSGDDNM